MTAKLWQKIKQLSRYSRKVIWYIRCHSISVHRQYRCGAKGDHVLRGQMIAEAGGFVSAPIYASVSGTVKVIEPRFTPAGSKVNSIVIENDGEYEEVEYSTPKAVSEMSQRRNSECNRRCRNCRYGWSWISNKGKIISKRTG